MRKTIRNLVLSVGVLFVLQTGSSAEGSFPADDTDELISSAKAVNKVEFPDSDDVILRDRTVVSYKASGTSLTESEIALKILTEKGKRENKTLTLHYNRSYGSAAFKSVEVIKPDASRIEIDIEKQSREMTASGQMARNIYDPNNRVVQLTCPELEIGDICRYTAVRKLIKPRVPETWSDYVLFEYTSPILEGSYRVEGPTNLPLLSVAIKDDLPETWSHSITTNAGTISQSWTFRDIPRIFKEPNMPALSTVAQRLMLSTIPDWETLSRWYWNLSLPHLEKITPEMEKKTRELCEGLNGRREKIEAVFRFVSQRIRYMGLTLEDVAPGYEPHDVSRTFNDRYGVCRDKAALLASMLRIAGFDAFPVLIMVGPKKDPEVPQPYFNHAITAVRNENGSFELMDPADENTRDILPRYLGDKSYLVATPQGEPLRTSATIPSSENMLSIATTARCDDEDVLEVESKIKFAGINDTIYRGRLARLNPRERRDFFRNRLNGVFGNLKLNDVKIRPAEIRDTTQPLRAVLNYSLTGNILRREEEIVLEPPQIGGVFGVANFILNGTGLEEREYPLRTDFPCGVKESFEIELSSNFGNLEALPSFETVDSKPLKWERKWDLADNLLSGETQLQIDTVEFAVEEYGELKEDLEIIERNNRQKVIFSPLALEKDPQANVVYLEDKTDCELADLHNWTQTRQVKMKILSYAGQKGYSEIKAAYNPAWESLNLISACVISPDGKKQSLGKDELNSMDADWVASAPRYPAAKLLVANLPGVELGSTIEYTLERKVSGKPFFSTRQYFGGFEPIKKKVVSLDLPREMELKIEETNLGEVSFTQKNKEDRSIYRWIAKNRRPQTRESSPPPLWNVVPTIFLSTGDWETYSAELREKFIEVSSGQTNTIKLARELVDSSSDTLSKAEAIRDFVDRNIKTAGPGLPALPLDALTPSDRVLADGYGNVSDQAVVLYVMSKAVGMSPSFVLASHLPLVEELQRPLIKAPQRDSFGYPLVALKLDPSERSLYLNDTDQYAAIGTTTHDQKTCLFFDTGTMAPIHALEGKGDRIQKKYALDLHPDGSLDMELMQSYYGTAFSGFRRRFAEMTPEKFRRYQENAVAAIAQSATLAEDLALDYSSYPGSKIISVKIENYAVRDGDWLYLNLPAGLTGLFHYSKETRENPLYLANPLRSRISYSLKLPAGYLPVVFPRDFEWRSRSGAGQIRFTTDYNPDQRELKIVQQAEIKPALIPESEYPLVRGVGSRLADLASRMIVLKKKAESLPHN